MQLSLFKPRFIATATLALTVMAATPSARAQEAEKPAAPSLSVEEVIVTPAAPGVDTLCKLSVKLRNGGEQTASLLAFQVAVNGQELPVYDTELFALPLDPGAVTEVPLFNFWTTETGRPAPADGKLTVEVRLTEAQWVKIEMEDEVEVWTPVGPVEGLPAAKSVTLKMKK
jgi:hypothetical protein